MAASSIRSASCRKRDANLPARQLPGMAGGRMNTNLQIKIRSCGPDFFNALINGIATESTSLMNGTRLGELAPSNDGVEEERCVDY